MVDPWSILVFVILCASCGPSPLVLPFVGWVVFTDHTALWGSIAEMFPGLLLPMVFLPLVSILVYYGNGLLLLFVDMLWRPEVLMQYKLQKTQTFDMKKIYGVLKVLTINQLFVIFPYAAFITWWSSTPDQAWIKAPLPSHKEMALHYLGYVVVNEVCFYYSHRLLHIKALYGRCHKLHHEFTSPIGLVASYCHPFEMLVSNVMPLFGGCLPLHSHCYTLLIWVIFGVLTTQTHHCGYHWPWLGMDHQPSYHDFHHEKFNCNYGAMGWLDKLHGTDAMWKEHLAVKEQSQAKAAKAA